MQRHRVVCEDCELDRKCELQNNDCIYECDEVAKTLCGYVGYIKKDNKEMVNKLVDK